MNREKQIVWILTLVASSVGLSVSAAEMQDEEVNRALNYYCANKNVASEQSVVVGKATQVNLSNGPFYLVQSPSAYKATINLVSQEVMSVGVSSECTEYLLSKGRLQGFEQGDILARVFFDFNKYNLTQDSRYILQSVVNKLKQQPSELILEGHTDNVGSKGYNLSLGLKRSEAVKSYLINKGINPQALTSVSKGEGKPIASNSTPEGRRQNRRVDMVSSD